MNSHYQDLDKLEEILRELEHIYLEGKLTPQRIATAQKKLDTLAEKAQRDESLGARRYLLYELQALLYDADGDIVRARQFAGEAAEVKGDSDLTTQTVRELIPMQIAEQPAQESVAPVDERYLGVKGWLVVFAIGMVLTPLLELYAFIDGLATAYQVIDTNSALAVFIYFEAAVNLIFGGFFIALCVSFAKLRRGTRPFAIWLLAALGVWGLIDLIVAMVLLSSYQVDDETTSSIVRDAIRGMIWAIIWLLYWIYSKRVRATFTK